MEFHIRCRAEDVSRYTFVPGDPDRARKVASNLDNARLVNDHRGLLVFTGQLAGVEMTVAATGMGGPTAAIVLEDADIAKAANFAAITPPKRGSAR